jgi:hypothetical protein
VEQLNFSAESNVHDGRKMRDVEEALRKLKRQYRWETWDYEKGYFDQECSTDESSDQRLVELLAGEAVASPPGYIIWQLTKLRVSSNRQT